MITRIVILILLSLSLQGCFVVGAAAGAAAVAAVYDHRKMEAILNDQKIANTISRKIKLDNDLGSSSNHINVTCFNHIVLLTGETNSITLRQRAEELARSVPDVTRIYNQITIKGATSSLSQASDSWITAKIKSEMLATKNLQSGTIKVITEDGTVYLMGIVKHNQADIAVDIARDVSGVQRVVKIFQYKD